MILEQRLERDKRNAEEAREAAEIQLGDTVYVRPSDFVHGGGSFGSGRTTYEAQRDASLKAICSTPFHVMAEVEVEDSDGNLLHKLWYGNQNSRTNICLSCNNGNQINILSWTHPGIQIALAEELGYSYDISDRRFRIVGVSPKARAKFAKLFPTICGIYEPGGSVGEKEERIAETGLKAVKLDMTAEQVRAFISKMDGIMFISGAPGSGKTTVALQRVRFLYDQQELREDHETAIIYSPETTCIFLANPNLIAYTENLLADQLDIPKGSVRLVPEFISQYLSRVWTYKHNARLQPREQQSWLEQRAREAFFGLCLETDLRLCWSIYEEQIASRLAQVSEASWVTMESMVEEKERVILEELISKLSRIGHPSNLKKNADPFASRLRMDQVYMLVREPYEELRRSLSGKNREEFDAAFSRWLFYVYDPLDCLITYFRSHEHEGLLRIRDGTGAKAQEAAVSREIFEDWSRRAYHREEEPWLAWLLRFSLPETLKPDSRFRVMPAALAPDLTVEDGQWTHVVIDEAQDLSVAQAALLSSFVDARGSLTVSSDFNQIVSPVHGMRNPEAIKFGCKIVDRWADSQFLFSKNMRQTKQITEFLRGFYSKTFNEPPPFFSDENLSDIKPQLYISKTSEFPVRIRQIVSVLQRSKHIDTIALLQINEDEDELHSLRGMLVKEGVLLAEIWEPHGPPGHLLTTSVERIKGLEYDCCIVLGMDNVEQSALKYSVNRAYVAISRPTRRLAILCTRFPKLLHGIDKSLYNIIE